MDTHPDTQLPYTEAKQDPPRGLEVTKDIQTGHLIQVGTDDYKPYPDKPMTFIDLAKWPTTALLGLTLRLAAPIVIGIISRTARNTRHKSYVNGYLDRDELLDFIYLATDLVPGQIHHLSAEEWIYGKLQPVPLHRLYALVQGHIFDTTAWKQAAKRHSTRETTTIRTTPQFIDNKAREHASASNSTPIGHPNSARNPTPIINLHLGEWDAKEMFGLAMAIAGQALVGTIIHRGWDANTFQHETWGFEWEELAALIYLTTEYRTDRQYPTTAEHFYAVIMQPQDILRLHWLVRGDIYDTATWIAVAHSQLDQESTQLEDD